VWQKILALRVWRDRRRQRQTPQAAAIERSGPRRRRADVVLRLLGQRDAVERFDHVALDRGTELGLWAERLEQRPDWVQDTYVFVSNQFSGHAPTTAIELGVRLGVLEPPDEPGRQTSLFG
jgi:uncharacterized protein YecE (DUF72 family)